MKKLVLAALLSTFAFGAAAAEKISFGVSATYPPFESMDANNQIAGFDMIWQTRCVSRCRLSVRSPTMPSTA